MLIAKLPINPKEPREVFRIKGQGYELFAMKDRTSFRIFDREAFEELARRLGEVDWTVRKLRELIAMEN